MSHKEKLPAEKSLARRLINDLRGHHDLAPWTLPSDHVVEYLRWFRVQTTEDAAAQRIDMAARGIAKWMHQFLLEASRRKDTLERMPDTAKAVIYLRRYKIEVLFDVPPDSNLEELLQRSNRGASARYVTEDLSSQVRTQAETEHVTLEHLEPTVLVSMVMQRTWLLAAILGSQLVCTTRKTDEAGVYEAVEVRPTTQLLA